VLGEHGTSDVSLITTASQARQRSRNCAFFAGDPFPAFAALPAFFCLNARNAGESCEAPDADA